MRIVAAYSLARSVQEDRTASQDLDDFITTVEEWLNWKGAHDTSVGQREVDFSDGRVAQLAREQLQAVGGTLASFVLTEPIKDGAFETHIDLACSDGRLVLSCRLGTMNADSALAPVSFEARCPGIVRDLIRSASWRSGTSHASATHVVRSGRDGGGDLANAIWDVSRGLPIVVISERYGSTLHPDLSRNIAYDLAGLANVVEIDRDASWTLSQAKGSVWSCYAGAIRLYWPFRSSTNLPYTHRFWTYYGLLRGGVSSAAAAARIREEVRRIVFEQSAFQTAPPLITGIRKQYVADQRKQARDADGYLELAEDYERENMSLRRELDERDDIIRKLNDHIQDQSEELNDQIDTLKEQKRQLIISNRFAQQAQSEQSDSDLVDDVDGDQLTVEEVVYQAMDGCKHLIFGDDVLRGIEDLATDAGPPKKIERYLDELDALTSQLQREHSLGMSMRQWLRERNVTYSPESDTIRNSPAEMRKRTWDDGTGKKREFEGHLKPSDSTSPDRLVRIYFRHDRGLNKTVVGWVGRHP